MRVYSCKVLSFALFFFPYVVSSQIFPREGSRLNYRIIGFSFPQVKDGTKCTLEIARGNDSTTSYFNKNIIKSVNCTNSKIIAEVPAFGSDYTWAVICAGEHLTKDKLHHFSVLMSPKVDTATKRLRIASEATQYKDAYVFLDANQVLYDMKGAPVWFLPDSSFSINEGTNVRDVKLSPAGTITFMTDDEVYDVNYNADILWKGPVANEASGVKAELYHHEFTRRNNGHYMVLGSESTLWKLPGYKRDSANMDNSIVVGTDSLFYKKMLFGTVLEYDQKGNVVWSWKSSAYFMESDLFKYPTAGDLFDIKDVHENSFYLDERAGMIYLSFRNISRILKVKYPEGNVIAEYGTIYKPGMTSVTDSLFCGQHSVGKTKDGYLSLYNNNSLSEKDGPQLILMEEPNGKAGNLKKIWAYNCTTEGLDEKEQNTYSKYTEHRHQKQSRNKIEGRKMRLTSGGSVTELPDGSLFASMNVPLSKIFIITRNKEISWNAIPEQRPSKDSLWNVFPTYRASIITDRKHLERLIWTDETGKIPGTLLKKEE